MASIHFLQIFFKEVFYPTSTKIVAVEESMGLEDEGVESNALQIQKFLT